MPLRLDALRRAAACCLTFGMLVLGCTDSHPGTRNGQTHWLRECKGSAECGTLLCVCGVCSAECDTGESCAAAVGEVAACKAAATASKKGQCPAALAEKRICVAECSDDAECTDRGADLRCASGICRLRDVSPSIADAGPPATTVLTARGGAIDDRRASFTRIDGGASADAGSSASPTGDKSSDGKSGDEKSGGKKGDGTDGTGEPTSSAAPNELTCENGEPAHFPDGVTVVASDLSDLYEGDSISMSDWTVSNDVLTWAVESRDTATVTVWRQMLSDGRPIAEPFAIATDVSEVAAMVAYGSDTLLRRVVDTKPYAVKLRLVPDMGPALNLANEPGFQIGRLLLDAESAYWMGTNMNQDTLTAWRSPRVPGDSVSLGAVASSTATSPYHPVEGPILIAGSLYVAASTSSAGQIFRAALDGSSPLAAFGPELQVIDDLTTDGTDLLLKLEPERDQLDNPITPARLVRMTSEGTVTDVTAIEETHPFTRLAVASDTLYWTANHYESSSSSGTVWSAPADGSSAPVKAIITPDSSVERVMSDQGALYFAFACPIDTLPNGATSRTHIMRLRP